MVSTIAGTDGKIFEGGCHCGSVRYSLTGPLRQILICHCDDCRRLAGASWASTRAYDDNYKLLRDETLAWYDSSAWARRGFCTACGSQLFYQLKKETEFSVAVGTLDDSSGFTIAGQLFTKSHPNWGPVDCSQVADIHDQLIAHYSAEEETNG